MDQLIEELAKVRPLLENLDKRIPAIQADLHRSLDERIKWLRRRQWINLALSFLLLLTVGLGKVAYDDALERQCLRSNQTRAAVTATFTEIINDLETRAPDDSDVISEMRDALRYLQPREC